MPAEREWSDYSLLNNVNFHIHIEINYVNDKKDMP